jgi:zinc transporter ZupT
LIRSSFEIGLPLLATAAALCGSILGVSVTGARGHARMVVPFSAGLLLGVSVFGLLPEIVGTVGWAGSLLLFAMGYFLLLAVNRYGYPVCPACSQDHDHEACAAQLHGFAAPLVSATALHSFLDGWSVSTAHMSAGNAIRLAVPLAVVVHKVPEGIALGSILLASMRSRMAALGWCLAAEAWTLAGGAAALAMAPRLDAAWISYPLALAGGCFVYLGFHAIHGEWRRRGAVPAFIPALTGAAGAAALQQGVRVLLR